MATCCGRWTPGSRARRTPAVDTRERVTVHRDTTVTGVSAPGGSRNFCEVATKSRCTGLFAHDDVATRIVTVTGSRTRAARLLRQAAPAAATRLASAW